MDQEFVQLVIKWVKLDDKIKEHMVQIKEMKEEKKQLEELVLTAMGKTSQDVLNLSSGGTLRKSVSKTKAPLTTEYINQILTEYTKDKSEAIFITESLMSKRPLNERTYLKRSAPRKPKDNTSS